MKFWSDTRIAANVNKYYHVVCAISEDNNELLIQLRERHFIICWKFFTHITQNMSFRVISLQRISIAYFKFQYWTYVFRVGGAWCVNHLRNLICMRHLKCEIWNNIRLGRPGLSILSIISLKSIDIATMLPIYQFMRFVTHSLAHSTAMPFLLHRRHRQITLIILTIRPYSIFIGKNGNNIIRLALNLMNCSYPHVHWWIIVRHSWNGVRFASRMASIKFIDAWI